ncbi:hypothetical protein QNA08_06020 [Chelatococcus sp. SYSU_G07232]|uniref:Secreted protein n=1 Tax=Chelatococcus albus TaxID=3047466 RepID=A0ABT7AEJ9_9HYPH|nr:hypothetical protein [Chelatococcus sp. SYSU_G07232]MDJ1157786.1 hypothetical protein [Chelatococcus sp. SYSU_G07232]
MCGPPLLAGAALVGFLGLAAMAAQPAEARTVCRSERVCARPPLVREGVRVCRVVRPAPHVAPRRVCRTY